MPSVFFPFFSPQWSDSFFIFRATSLSFCLSLSACVTILPFFIVSSSIISHFDRLSSSASHLSFSSHIFYFPPVNSFNRLSSQILHPKNPHQQPSFFLIRPWIKGAGKKCRFFPCREQKSYGFSLTFKEVIMAASCWFY